MIFTYRVKIQDALSWVLGKGETLRWAIQDAAEEAARDGGMELSDEDWGFPVEVDGPDFIVVVQS